MTDLDALQAQLDREVSLRRQLVDLAKTLGSTLDPDALIGTIIAAADDLTGAETASVLLLDEESGELEIAFAAGGVAEAITRQRVPAGQGIAGWVLANRQTAVVADTATDARFYSGVDRTSGFDTSQMVAVPLLAGDRAVGVLEVINKPGGFSDDDVDLAEALAGLAAIALENAATYAKLADAVVTARMSYRM